MFLLKAGILFSIPKAVIALAATRIKFSLNRCPPHPALSLKGRGIQKPRFLPASGQCVRFAAGILAYGPCLQSPADRSEMAAGVGCAADLPCDRRSRPSPVLLPGD